MRCILPRVDLRAPAPLLPRGIVEEKGPFFPRARRLSKSVNLPAAVKNDRISTSHAVESPAEAEEEEPSASRPSSPLN